MDGAADRGHEYGMNDAIRRQRVRYVVRRGAGEGVK